MELKDYLIKKYLLKNRVTGETEFVEYSQAYLNYREQVRQKFREVYNGTTEPTLAQIKDLNQMFKILRTMEEVEPDLAEAKRILPKLKEMYGVDGSGDDGQEPCLGK